MAANKFVTCGPDGPMRAKRLQPQEWATHQQTITDLYVHQNKSLDDLMTIMASKHGLIANRHQYTEKLRQWKVQKNLPGKVMRSAVCKLHQNPSRSDFTYMTKPISEQRMIRYQQRHPSLDPEASPAPSTPSQLDWQSELESVSSPTKSNSLDRIEEAVSSALPADMMELSISSDFPTTTNAGTAHHMNGGQQFKATITPALTADAGGNAAERELDSAPTNLTSNTKERTEASGYPDAIADDAVKMSPGSSKSTKGNPDDLQLILPEPPGDLGFGEATLREEAPHATFAMLPSFDRASLETRRIAVAAAMQNNVYPQPQQKAIRSIEWRFEWRIETV